MTGSKAWDWEKVRGEHEDYWKIPCVESHYLADRWKGQGKKRFLDLGAGLGRHAIFFAKKGFETSAFDLSANAIERLKERALSEKLRIDSAAGDMLSLPYGDGSFDCIMCYHVVSHQDTAGVKQSIAEIRRVLADGGECFLTLGSKETWGWKQDWPLLDENTKLRQEDGPENNIPHFYADEGMIPSLLCGFHIARMAHAAEYYDKDGALAMGGWHYYLLIRKR
ncbi:MAG: class I SAM-dependent methyltransferase [Rickettsiales bacterium]|jgi:SAM-dependent methyltransferase|nr:class I SAM-dependent methyltransferase [Rickettsiales bacterium]